MDLQLERNNLVTCKKSIQKKEDKIIKQLYNSKKSFFYNLIINKVIEKNDKNRQKYKFPNILSIIKNNFIEKDKTIIFISILFKNNILWIQLIDNNWIIYD